jgi:hypothetical protein
MTRTKTFPKPAAAFAATPPPPPEHHNGIITHDTLEAILGGLSKQRVHMHLKSLWEAQEADRIAIMALIGHLLPPTRLTVTDDGV